MIESLKYTLNESVNWMVNAGLNSIAPDRGQSSEGVIMNEVDKDSLYSSEDTKSHDLSTTSEYEENYFSCPNDDSLLQTPDELEAAIERVKNNVLETDGVTEERIKLVQRLISLRLRLEEIKEAHEEKDGMPFAEEFKIVNQHHFFFQTQVVHRNPQYCDKCSGIIWTVFQHWFRCKSCFYQCHSKCLNNLSRKCPIVIVGVETDYLSSICPEVGLPAQNYQCFECKTRFTLNNSWMEPRRCDYNGRYYCPLCHKNKTMSIPARILHNWDFDERPISEESRQFLSLMSKKPNINLEKVNPKLFNFVEELNTVKRLREDIILMKDFFMTCREAIAQKLLRRLDEKQHFVETSYMYSLQDLIDVKNESMIKFLDRIHSGFVRHIKEECQICKGKGFICEICENIQEIFPFDSATHICPLCHAVFHSICFAKRDKCPKCLRHASRSTSSLAIKPKP